MLQFDPTDNISNIDSRVSNHDFRELKVVVTCMYSNLFARGLKTYNHELLMWRDLEHGCDLDLETPIYAGEQRFKELAYELG